jgi:CheY-like chemotaxis protein
MKPKRKIVLIDDDHDDYEIFTMALTETDPSIDCIYYDSAKDALHKLANLQSSLPDFIFLDLNMPGMDGIQFLEEFKRTHMAHLPIIIYSTTILPPHRQKIEELGVYKSIVKPYSHGELIKILKTILVEN